MVYTLHIQPRVVITEKKDTYPKRTCKLLQNIY